MASLKELATGGLQDADLYQATIADAVQNGLPTVIVFASPAFCTNAVCGPQVEVLQQLKGQVQGTGQLCPRRLLREPGRDPGRPQPRGDLDGGAGVAAAEHRVDLRDRPAGRHIRQVRRVRHAERNRAGVPAGPVAAESLRETPPPAGPRNHAQHSPAPPPAAHPHSSIPAAGDPCIAVIPAQAGIQGGVSSQGICASPPRLLPERGVTQRSPTAGIHGRAPAVGSRLHGNDGGRIRTLAEISEKY